MKTGFVFYNSYLEMISAIPDAAIKLEAYEALAQYGINGVVSDSQNPFIMMLMASVQPTVTASKQRYTDAVEAGKAGGRPQTVNNQTVIDLYQEGKTPTEIAKELDCSVNTVKSIITRKGAKGAKGANLNNNINNNIKDNIDNINTDIDIGLICEACKRPIRDDNFKTAEQLAEITSKKLGYKLCYDCAKRWVYIRKKTGKYPNIA